MNNNTEIKKLLSRILRYSKVDLEKRLAKTSSGMTPLQYAVLTLIYSGKKSIREISREMLVSPPSLVPVVDFLENKKMVIRRSDPKDRRKIPIEITSKGSALVKRIREGLDSSPVSKSLRKMGERKVKIITKLLKELVENIEPRI